MQGTRGFTTPSVPLHQHNQRNFRPHILRPWPLLALIFITLVLIGLVEYAAIKLPHGPSFLDKLDSKANTFRNKLDNLTSRDANAARLAPRQPSASFSFVDFISGDVSSSSSFPHPSAAPPSAFVPVISSAPGIAVSAFVPVSSSTFAANPSAFVPTRSSGGDTTAPASTGAPAPNAFVPTKVTSRSSTLPFAGDPPSSALVPVARPTTTQAVDHSHSDKEHRHFYPWWSGMDTFLGTYFATLIAALYRVLWTVVLCSFNLIEPLRALSQPSGAPADVALFAFYQSRSGFLGPVSALLKRRWALALVAFTALLTNLLPAFASESTYVNTNWNCPNPDVTNKHNPCPPTIFVDPGALRVLQALLVFAVLVVFWLVYLQFVDKSYIPEDPRSLATIATLTQHPDLIDDFNRIPPNATISEMKRMFRGRKYRLELYRSESGTDCYGIRPTIEGTDFKYIALSNSRPSGYPTLDDSIQTTGAQMPRPRRIWPMDIGLVILIIGLFGLVLAYLRDNNQHDGFNTFFNSDTFGPRFILTLSGTAIATLWKSAEQSSVVNAPWNRLATGPSSADDTILFTPSITPISSTIRAFRHGYFSVGAITMVTLLADVGLNTVIGGVAYTTGQTKQQFHASTYFSLITLGIMLVVAVMLIVSRFREVTLPRRPDTLGAVISYMAGSPLDNVEKTKYMIDSSGNDKLWVMDKKYSLEQVAREDGQFTWMVIATY